MDNLTSSKYLLKYHKCLYALIQVMTKRIALFYSSKFRQSKELEQIETHFRAVVQKIMKKLSEIESRAKADLGIEEAKRVLMPFTAIIQPIISIFGLAEAAKFQSIDLMTHPRTQGGKIKIDNQMEVILEMESPESPEKAKAAATQRFLKQEFSLEKVKYKQKRGASDLKPERESQTYKPCSLAKALNHRLTPMRSNRNLFPQTSESLHLQPQTKSTETNNKQDLGAPAGTKQILFESKEMSKPVTAKHILQMSKIYKQPEAPKVARFQLFYKKGMANKRMTPGQQNLDIHGHLNQSTN